MNKLYMLLLCFFVPLYPITIPKIGDIEWFDVYVINNSDIDIIFSADVAHLQNINELVGKRFDRFERFTWFIPKRDEDGIGGVTNVGRLNLLSDLRIEPNVFNITELPTWAQKPLYLSVDKYLANKTLIIYINKTDYGWVTQQLYVTAVKMAPGGPSGYHIVIDQR